MEGAKNKRSLLDIVFEEKVIVYALLPFIISFSFFGIIVESVKIISNFNSSYFYWYPIYFIMILPFSIYTNSSIFAGGKFLRSIVETIFEIFLLLIFNLVFLKSFNFGRNINEFLDINFGISVAFWIALRITNGHIVRVLNFPYELITTFANSIATNVKLDEVFDEKYFEKYSVRKSLKNLVVSLIVMLFFVSISIILSGSSLIIIIYMVFFVIASVMLVLNISKVYLLEDSFIKKISIDNMGFLNNLVRFSFISSIVVVIISLILSVGIYLGASEISKKINLAFRDKINQILSQEQKINEEEIKKIKERLASPGVTNEYVVPKVQKVERKGIDWGILWFFIQYLLLIFTSIVFVGFVLKEVFKLKDVPILGFFVRVYEIFAYVVGRFFSWILGILRRLFGRKRFYIPKDIEEELISSIKAHREEVSKEKADEIETIVKIFIDMLSYTSYVLPYRRSMGVEEYCNQLKLFLPEFSKHLDFISDVVNESRYSNHLLPSEIVVELKNKVNEIISKVRIKVKVAEEFRGG